MNEQQVNPKQSKAPWIIAGVALFLVFLMAAATIAYVVWQRSATERMLTAIQQAQQQATATPEPAVEATSQPDPQTTGSSGSQSTGGSSGGTSGGSSGGSSSSGPSVTRESGKDIGEVKKVWEEGGSAYMNIDYVQFLTGQAALDAARADGVIGPTDPLENDVYVRNQNKRIRTFKISPYVKVTVFLGQTAKASSLSEFRSIYEHYLWWVTVDNGTVTKIDAQYTP